MAARMNGTVGYASEPGCTKFWIRLPRA